MNPFLKIFVGVSPDSPRITLTKEPFIITNTNSNLILSSPPSRRNLLRCYTSSLPALLQPTCTRFMYVSNFWPNANFLITERERRFLRQRWNYMKATK